MSVHWQQKTWFTLKTSHPWKVLHTIHYLSCYCCCSAGRWRRRLQVSTLDWHPSWGSCHSPALLLVEPVGNAPAAASVSSRPVSVWSCTGWPAAPHASQPETTTTRMLTRSSHIPWTHWPVHLEIIWIIPNLTLTIWTSFRLAPQIHLGLFYWRCISEGGA